MSFTRTVPTSIEHATIDEQSSMIGRWALDAHGVLGRITGRVNTPWAGWAWSGERLEGAEPWMSNSPVLVSRDTQEALDRSSTVRSAFVRLLDRVDPDFVREAAFGKCRRSGCPNWEGNNEDVCTPCVVKEGRALLV